MAGDKFTWEPGDITMSFPQCRDCKHNAGAYECDKFGRKPTKYISNEEECPKYTKE